MSHGSEKSKQVHKCTYLSEFEGRIVMVICVSYFCLLNWAVLTHSNLKNWPKSGFEGHTRWEDRFLCRSIYKRNGPPCSKQRLFMAKPWHSHTIFILWVNPPTSPHPTLSALPRTLLEVITWSWKSHDTYTHRWLLIMLPHTYMHCWMLSMLKISGLARPVRQVRF